MFENQVMIYWEVLVGGFYDVANPCNGAAIIIFLIYLSILGKSQARVFNLGLLYCLVAWCAHMTALLGAWDGFLTWDVFLIAVRWFYTVLGGVFIILGVLELGDWRRQKSHNMPVKFTLRRPAFLAVLEENKPKKSFVWFFKTVGLGLLTALISFLGAVLSTAFPQDEIIYIIHSDMMARGSVGFALSAFALYSLVMVAPMVGAWLMVRQLSSTQRGHLRTVSFYKLIVSALYLSIGVGLGYYFMFAFEVV